MLTKTTKFLNNPHFMVKPAIIELNRSIIQAGGASSESNLSDAMISIQEALKNTDWNTRKAASLALMEFASSKRSYFGSFKSSCICSLESCRFDKVKPVRDTVVHALQMWKSLKENNGHSYVKSPHNSKPNDWNIQVNVPNTRNVSLTSSNDEESEGSCVTKTFTSTQEIGYEYVPMDDKHRFSSASNIENKKFEDKLMGVKKLLVEKEISTEEQRYYEKIEDRRSLESNVMESSCEILHGCCMQTSKEMSLFQEKLLEIDSKQSNLLDLLQIFTTKTTDSLSTIQSKVSSLEHVVDQMAQKIGHEKKHLKSTTKFLNKTSNTTSPRPSTCTPRQSLETLTRQSPFGRGKSGISTNQGIDSWMDLITRNHVGNNSSINRKNAFEVKNGGVKILKGYLSEKELDAAYVDALNCGDDVALVYLLDKTGPVLEMLSHRTANVIVSTLSSFLSEQRFLNSIIPWLQQVVELSGGHGQKNLMLTAKTRREFLYAIQEAMNKEFTNASTKRSITQLVTKLHQVWGKEISSFTHLVENENAPEMTWMLILDVTVGWCDVCLLEDKKRRLFH
ncbi:hypothetical protein L1887_38666 [Cichorium endivia]|nr:hypothetical protein L1887_38666 [Cichorium endivia]